MGAYIMMGTICFIAVAAVIFFNTPFGKKWSGDE